MTSSQLPASWLLCFGARVQSLGLWVPWLRAVSRKLLLLKVAPNPEPWKELEAQDGKLLQSVHAGVMLLALPWSPGAFSTLNATCCNHVGMRKLCGARLNLARKLSCLAVHRKSTPFQLSTWGMGVQRTGVLHLRNLALRSRNSAKHPLLEVIASWVISQHGRCLRRVPYFRMCSSCWSQDKANPEAGQGTPCSSAPREGSPSPRCSCSRARPEAPADLQHWGSTLGSLARKHFDLAPCALT